MTGSETCAPSGYPPLPVSLKGHPGFRTATTSFIYPDHIVPNVRMLWPHVDEIELLFFESRPDSLPSEDDIEALLQIQKEGKISYNIHLPLDIDLCHPDPGVRQRGADILSRVFDLAGPLVPTTYTLHLSYTEERSDASSLKNWQRRTCGSIEKILSGSIPPERISVETLSYPPQWLMPILEPFDLSMCLDVGHLIEHDRNLTAVYDMFAERISIIHLYGGVEKGRGHLPLNRLPETHTRDISRILRDFDKTVCLEVFSYDHLCTSLEFLQHLLNSENHFPERNL